jgi:ubiquinone/menaquinone biosynthesis C-methylase UbiE
MFHERSYKSHASGFAEDLVNPERIRIAESWFDEGTADAWRHARAYEIGSLLGGIPDERWLTVGDGRFGLDAARLMKAGVQNVLATDLDESLLRAGKERGVISEYRVENAEKLSFQNHSFDYVFCKEALHHFPRPAIALYEMLRVARKGVILIEPNDRKHSLARGFVAAARSILGKGRHMDANAYEDSGNYVYAISRREIEKTAMAINLPCVAFKPLNDAYVPGLEFEPAGSPAYRKMLRKIGFRNLLCNAGLDEAMLLMAALFHEPPESGRISAMGQSGWRFSNLPRNPYLP